MKTLTKLCMEQNKILGRPDDTDSMIRSSRKKTYGSDETRPGKINLTKLSWRMTILKLSD